LRREILTPFLNRISSFPSWIKKIIYNKLSEEIETSENLSYVFATYKPVLTYKGKCENDFKKSGFDTNIYNILDAADKNQTISDISLNTYLSMEEIASYFLFCTDEGYFEIPDDSRILNIAGFIAGKYRTGEYFVKDGSMSESQLDKAVDNYENNNKENKKFGQILIDCGLITEKQLDMLLSFKEEAKKRFILDYDDVPKIKQEYSKNSDEYAKQISDLKEENKILKTKLEQLLSMVKKDD
jgi:hypothetical protein